MRFTFAICILASFVVPVSADPPHDPENDSVEPCDTYDAVIGVPYDGSAGEVFEIRVNIRNHNNDPLPGIELEWDFGDMEGVVVFDEQSLTGVTDEDGDAFFQLSVGGCSASGSEEVVLSSTLGTIRTYRFFRSPDSDASGCVDVGDFQDFGAEYGVCQGSCCHDYNNDGSVGLADYAIFGDGYGSGCKKRR